MRVRHLGIAASLLGLCAALPGACLLPEIGIKEQDPPDDGGDAGSGCMRAFYPPPPNKPDAMSIDPVVVAMRSINMGDGAAGTPGFDLDYTCTCFEDAGETCTTGMSAPQCDEDGGIDNEASDLFRQLVDNLGPQFFGSTYYSKSAETGNWSVLIRVSEYNGTPDDPAVNVALYVSPGFVMPAVPAWDGMDAWPVSEDSLGALKELSDPAYVSNGAYVADGVLVATLPSVELRLSGGNSTISVKLLGGVLSGTFEFIEEGARLTKGTLAGRWSEKGAFESLSSFRGPPVLPGDPPLKLCIGDPFYNAIKAAVCSARDILTDPLLPASAPCDAVSVGIGFETFPAQLGEILPVVAPSEGCMPVEKDPAADKCPG